jgi:peptidoglycan/xylan/chitin deacetylase (PgdA/CDA1 family)
MYSIKIFIISLLAVNSAHAKEISISFDDAPRSNSTYFSGEERTKKLIEGLKRAGVTRAAFYLNPVRMDASGIDRVKAYGEAGHLLGNHTFDHPALDEVGPEKYIESILKAHEQIKNLKGFKPYFRFTFLGEGKTKEVRDQIRKALDDHEYINAYVTVDNFDWYMDDLFQKAVKAKKKIDFELLGKTYVEALYNSIVFYDDLANKVFGRSPKHVILLHENDLVALYIEKLVDHLKKNGWKILSPEEAYSDPISRQPDTLHNRDGRIAAIASENNFYGVIRDRYQDKVELESLFRVKKVFR